jgi:hypothetical protein
MRDSESKLPKEILSRCVYSSPGGEYAWRVGDILDVIDAAEMSLLFNLGGTLQFVLPDGGICECNWIDVDAGEPPAKLDWEEKVRWGAINARRALNEATKDVDLVASGRDGFEQLRELEEQGVDLASLMCFVWSVSDQTEFEAFSPNAH